MFTVAVSSRALFNLEDSNKIFNEKGQDAFNEYMRANEKKPLRQGVAFNLVKKLLAINSSLTDRDKVEVILLSRNSPDAGLRVMNSVQHHELAIERAVFTQGKDRFRYAKAFGTHLFLSATPEDVQAAIGAGIAGGVVNPASAIKETNDGVVRIAFDGDSVLFSDEAEKVNHQEGLKAFQESEQALAKTPLGDGPFKQVLIELHKIQTGYPKGCSPVKIALVTARGVPVHERVLRTLRAWDVEVDEAVFCGGLPKGPLLDVFGADIFFDDTPKNVASGSAHVASAHVPFGVVNN